jgi:hypothetical protein
LVVFDLVRLAFIAVHSRSALAAENLFLLPWRTEDARYRSLGAHRLPNHPHSPAATCTNMEDVSSQPSRSNGIDGLLDGADDYDESAVRVHRAGTSSAPE